MSSLPTSPDQGALLPTPPPGQANPGWHVEATGQPGHLTRNHGPAQDVIVTRTDRVRSRDVGAASPRPGRERRLRTPVRERLNIAVRAGELCGGDVVNVTVTYTPRGELRKYTAHHMTVIGADEKYKARLAAMRAGPSGEDQRRDYVRRVERNSRIYTGPRRASPTRAILTVRHVQRAASPGSGLAFRLPAPRAWRPSHADIGRGELNRAGRRVRNSSWGSRQLLD
jgi:hypothetical protein